MAGGFYFPDKEFPKETTVVGTRQAAEAAASSIIKGDSARTLFLSGLQHLTGLGTDEMSPPARSTHHGFVNLATG
jgi:hypothetical protein